MCYYLSNDKSIEEIEDFMDVVFDSEIVAHM